MRKNKNILALTLSAAMAFGLLTGCGAGAPVENEQTQTEDTVETADVAEETTEAESDSIGEEVTIIYTNDIHSYIDNVVKDGDGNITGDGLRFSKIAAMVNDLKADGKNVLLVDAGDEVQGDVYGAMDEGVTIIDIMNAVGYNLATPGNHDFDYGMFQFMKNIDSAQFPYVSCNFRTVKTGDPVLPAYKILEAGGKKIAFVGVTTPDTITSSTPTYFQDENGEFIYEIDGNGNMNTLYESVQSAINEAGEEADYVFGLGHIGIGDSSVTSEEIIANVSGFDAFIDGHSHSTVEGTYVKDKDGKDVLLTQTGCYLNAIGEMTISVDGTISTKLINEYDREDDSVAELEKAWIDEVNAELGEEIGVLESDLYICNPDIANQRLIRAQEMNLGDFCADSIYWFFNDRLELECDVAIMNGGGIRAQLEKGPLTYLSAKSVNPFGNMICLISATGQQILDALEMGVTEIGGWNDEWDCPAENGGFLHVAGLSYTVDSSVPTGVETDDKGLFTGVKGDYRVKDVKIYNKESGKYEHIDLEKEYMLGGINYLLRNDGNGMSMFDDDPLMVDYVGQDYVILAEYIKSFEPDGDMPLINTKNSPLSSYKGYLLDYDNPYGAGRISIIME